MNTTKKLLPAAATVLRPPPPLPGKESSILSNNHIKSHFQNGRTADARKLFDEMPDRDVITWTSMISGYTSCGCYSHAWNTFREMIASGIEPNAYSASSVLKTCKAMKDLTRGKSVHAVAVKLGLEGSIYVDNAVMELYATCSSSIDEALMVFDLMREKNEVSWTTLISGYTHRGDACNGLAVYRRMIAEGEEPNPFSFSIAVRALASIGADFSGQLMHGSAMKHGFWSNLAAMNSVLDMYCRCSRLTEAANFFDEMSERDSISWNTIISGLEATDPSRSLQLFSQMENRGFTPSRFTFTSIAAACGNLPSFNHGKEVHGAVLRRGLESSAPVNNAFIDMYAKCGSLRYSRRVFDAMPEKNLISWTSMVVGYGSHGVGKEVVKLFQEMVRSGIEPERVAFKAVLSGCSHAGLVEDGLKYFELMRGKYKIEPCREVYGCLVDLLGRAGRTKEAYQLVEKTQFVTDDYVTGPLLRACRDHKDYGTGKIVARRVLDSGQLSRATYLILSNIYAAQGLWSEFARVRKMISTDVGKKNKEVGGSWIEVKNDVVSFVSGDKKIPQVESVYGILKILLWDIRDSGYVTRDDQRT